VQCTQSLDDVLHLQVGATSCREIHADLWAAGRVFLFTGNDHDTLAYHIVSCIEGMEEGSIRKRRILEIADDAEVCVSFFTKAVVFSLI